MRPPQQLPLGSSSMVNPPGLPVGSLALVEQQEMASDVETLRRMATTGPGKQKVAFPEHGLTFTSRFDGGNMADVLQTADGEFNVRVAEDAAAFGISTGYTTWFCFELERGGDDNTQTDKPPMQEVQLVLDNLNPQRGLFMNGYTITYCSVDAAKEQEISQPSCVFQDQQRWTKLSTPLSFEKYMAPTASESTVAVQKAKNGDSSTGPFPRGATMQQELDGDQEGGQNGREESRTPPAVMNDDSTSRKTVSESAESKSTAQELKIRVSFTYRFKFPRERVRFAFCYPYTYTRVQEELAAMDLRFAGTVKAATSTEKPIVPQNSAIYYHRELLTRSLEGLRVDLLTLSSFDGITSTRASLPTSLQQAAAKDPHIPSDSALQFDPKVKRTVLISARVHPGETPANFMLNGMLQLLLHPTDEAAIALRRHFVFKIIPMLNPDGVCQGFYRTDTRGVNLNRVYEDPQPELAPSVFALKELLLQIVDDYGGADSVAAQENVVYLDLHAHANRRGCFVFGNNHLPVGLGRGSGSDCNGEEVATALARQVDTQLFARLVSLHTPFFDYMACLFDKENMTKHDLRNNNNATTSRQGCSRVALYQATGLTYVYTIECNYNEGRRNLRASALSSPMASSASSPSLPLSTTATSTRRCSSSKGAPKRPQPESLKLARHTAPQSGSRLYLKYSPAEWTDVGVGSLMALLDLFELPGGDQKLDDSPFRSRDGIRKSLLAEVRSANVGQRAASAKSTRPSKQKSKSTVIKHAASSKM